MRFVRSLLAVLIGFAAFLVVIRLMSAVTGGADASATAIGFVLLSLVWTVASAMLAGFIAARLAGSHEFPHTAALGLLLVMSSLLSMRQQGITRPGWYQTTIAGCGPVSAMLGAAIRVLTKGRRAGNS